MTLFRSECVRMAAALGLVFQPAHLAVAAERHEGVEPLGEIGPDAAGRGEADRIEALLPCPRADCRRARRRRVSLSQGARQCRRSPPCPAAPTAWARWWRAPGWCARKS